MKTLSIYRNIFLLACGILITSSLFADVKPARIIDNRTIAVSSPKAKTPVAIRYAWAKNPFRTDDWQCISSNKSPHPVNMIDHEIIHIWPGDVPGETEAKHAAEKEFDQYGQISRLRNVTNPRLTVYQAPEEKNTGAAVIVCPGGGYSILAVTKEGFEVASWLNSQGINAFVLEYRVPDKKEGALQDVQRALAIVRDRADEWNINSDQIGVMGFSAGGSLSARLSTQFETKTYEIVDQSDKQSCRPDFTLLIYPAYLDQGENHSLTPELEINDKTPPMFIFATADDPYGNSALVMAGALRNAKIPVELHFYPIGGHGYGLRPGKQAAKMWPQLAEIWLNKILSEPTDKHKVACIDNSVELVKTFQSNHPQDTIRLRILTYNIYHGETMNGDFNIDTIANRIAFHKPDLVAMQEVDRLTNRARKMDLVTELGYRTKLAPVFARAMYYDSGEYGEGVLSRYSFISVKNIALPALPEHEPRAALEVLIELPGGDTIAFVGTHFEHTLNAPDRVTQAAFLAEKYKNFPYPLILSGDLNDVPSSKAITELRKTFSMSAGDNPEPTFSSDSPQKKIDYVLLDRNHKWNVVSTEVIHDQVVSDHCGYLAVIQLIIER